MCYGHFRSSARPTLDRPLELNNGKISTFVTGLQILVSRRVNCLIVTNEKNMQVDMFCIRAKQICVYSTRSELGLLRIQHYFQNSESSDKNGQMPFFASCSHSLWMHLGNGFSGGGDLDLATGVSQQMLSGETWAPHMGMWEWPCYVTLLQQYLEQKSH